MKRIQEKVKDIVEVCSHEILQDFISHPEQTLTAYHFTDVTADLMAKWLDQICGVQILSGTAYALAGYRGVGKSHFLATLGAIVAQPELRSRIADSHVSASAQMLKRRRYPVVFVKRGLHETLTAELREAVAQTFEVETAELSHSISEILDFATRQSGEVPLVLLIDTAFERTSRVAREDGFTLGEIAAVSKTLNVFVGVALDDDIAGADGVNSAIAGNYKIEYLDQEHLYRIVDTHIFPKQRQMTQVLHEIYTYFREVLPAFRWSEQRFSALYPLHPIILETAPFVRLYVQDFALLSFASEAGRKILGRPAGSLIALDEVFDSVETTLRKTEDLKDAFAAYDKINAEVVSQIPIMQRLQAKLILKALLVLSLDGSGATAAEIGAAMLIFDENDAARAVQIVEEIVGKFAAFAPDDVQRKVDGHETAYKFKISGKDDLNNALSLAAGKVTPDVVPKILRRLAKERFTDWTLSDETGGGWMDSYAVWRGGLRRGRVIWDLADEAADEARTDYVSEFADWELLINRREFAVGEMNAEVPKVFWQPAELRSDEIETIRRYYVLTTQPELRDEFGEQIRAAGHAHTIAVEKIWNRIFLQDGKFVIDGFDYNFTEEARVSTELSEIFSLMLEPFFEARYSLHPYFPQLLGMNEVSILVNDLFSGAHQNLSEVQKLAETFALPLGLVALRGGFYALESEEKLLNLPLAQEVLALVKISGEAAVSLKTVYRQLKKSPNGLVREAQHLILTALVAQRQIEFITTKGDRINRRSLDLKIIWDDIEGIAKPVGAIYSESRLTEWAKILTGNEMLHSIDDHEARETVKKSLEGWLFDWETARVLERFAGLPDEILNTKIWRLAVHSERTFGSVAETVRTVKAQAISVDEGLHRIADAFSNSEDEFFSSTNDLVIVEDFIGGAAKRAEITAYLAVCETTGDDKIEADRANLLAVVEESYQNPSRLLNVETSRLWENFHAGFSEYFAFKHDSVMKSHQLQEKFDRILSSREWWEFSNLSTVRIFPQSFWIEAQAVCRRFKQLDCRENVRELLAARPFCSCSFNLSEIEDWEKLPQNLWEIINHGLFSYRRSLLLLRDALVPLIESFSERTNEMEFVASAGNLVEILRKDVDFPPLSDKELFILQKIIESMPAAPRLDIKIPAMETFLSRRELREKITQWIDEMPGEPVLMRV